MTTFDDELAATIAPPRRHTLGDLVRRTAARAPDKTAIVYRDVRQSYADLDATINRTAKALAERGAGQGPPDCYAVGITTMPTPHPLPSPIRAATVPQLPRAGSRKSHSFSNIRVPSVSSWRTRWCRSSMVGAAERVRVAALALTYGIASMHAAVEQQMYRTVLVARDNNRLQSDPTRYVVARLWNLTFMSDIYPVAIPYLLQLFFEDGGIVVDSAVHALVLNQMVESACVESIFVISPPP